MASYNDEKNEFFITMPEIFCSFPLKMHPDAPHLIEVGDAALRNWCERIAVVACSECFQLPAAVGLFSVNHNVNSGYGLLVMLYFANAISTHRMLPILKLMNWFFLIDNCVDEPGMLGADPESSARIVESVTAVFKPTSARCTEDNLAPREHVKHTAIQEDVASGISSQADAAQALAHVLKSAAAEWWSEMCVDMPLSQQAHFCEIFLGYLSCILKETPFRSACMLPDVEAYLRIRTHSIGWYPLSVLTEYTLCMEMEQEALSNPLLKALKQSVCESGILVNDVISFRKEYERGDHFNIIMVLCFQKLQAAHHEHCAPAAAGLPTTWPVEMATPALLQESMNEACKMIRERDRQCVCMIERIQENQKLMAMPGMGAFLEAMGNYVSANLYWHLTSERYWAHTSSTLRSPHRIVLKGMAGVLGSRTFVVQAPLAQVTN